MAFHCFICNNTGSVPVDPRGDQSARCLCQASIVTRIKDRLLSEEALRQHELAFGR